MNIFTFVESLLKILRIYFSGLNFKNFHRELFLAPLRQDFTKFREVVAPEQNRQNKKNDFNLLCLLGETSKTTGLV